MFHMKTNFHVSQYAFCLICFIRLFCYLLQQMANLVAENMKANGTKFIEKSVPTKVEKLADGSLKVKWKNVENDDEYEDVFDTVMFAIGKKTTVSPSVQPSFLPPVRPSVRPSVPPPVRPCASPFVRLRLSVPSSVCPTVYPSACPAV